MNFTDWKIFVKPKCFNGLLWLVKPHPLSPGVSPTVSPSVKLNVNTNDYRDTILNDTCHNSFELYVASTVLQVFNVDALK